MGLTVITLFLLTAGAVFTQKTPQKSIIDFLKTDMLTFRKSSTIKLIKKNWPVHKKAVEDALTLAVYETFDNAPANLFYKRPESDKEEPDLKSYYMSDNVVNVLFMDLKLRQMPRYFQHQPYFKVELDRNRILFDCHLTDVIIDGTYKVFRNKSSLVNDSSPDFSRHSPFSLQEVPSEGNVSITLEYNIRQRGATSLVGYTMNLDTWYNYYDTRSTATIEIYEDKSESPPIIAPYFRYESIPDLKSMLILPILEDMKRRIQAALYSCINTTTVYGNDTMTIRHHFEQLATNYSEVMAGAINYLNTLLKQKNNGILKLQDLACIWDEDGPSFIKLSNLTLNGLDGAYSSNRAGLYFRRKIPHMIEDVKFKTMQVHGNFHMKNSQGSHNFEFATELTDVSIVIRAGQSELYKEWSSLTNVRFEEFSMKHDQLDLKPRDRHVLHALISGHIFNELKDRLVPLVFELLQTAFNPASKSKLSLNPVASGWSKEEPSDEKEEEHYEPFSYR